MSIIIEGPDCSGKTTLIDTLFVDYCRIHNGRYHSPQEALTQYLRQCPAPNMNHDNIVWDRNYISEQIYGSIYRNSKIPDQGIELLEARLRDIKTVVVLCRPPKELVMANWKKLKEQRSEYIENESYFQDIIDAYTDSIDNYTSLPVLYYDYTNQKGNLMDRIIDLKADMYD